MDEMNKKDRFITNCIMCNVCNNIEAAWSTPEIEILVANYGLNISICVAYPRDLPASLLHFASS